MCMYRRHICTKLNDQKPEDQMLSFTASGRGAIQFPISCDYLQMELPLPPDFTFTLFEEVHLSARHFKSTPSCLQNVLITSTGRPWDIFVEIDVVTQPSSDVAFFSIY